MASLSWIPFQFYISILVDMGGGRVYTSSRKGSSKGVEGRNQMSQLNRKKLGLCSLFLTALLFVASSNVAWAQVSASISGRIKDPSDAAIPAATVRVTSLETGATRTAATDERGNYRVLSLPVGRYEVRAENAGFKAAVQTGINLVVGQEAVVNLRLEVGGVQQQITVTGESPLVNTTTASVAGMVGEQQVKELPLNGRSFDLLITLNPGAVNYTAMKRSGQSGGNFFSVVGRRPGENITLLNGVEYTGAGQTAITPGGASGQLLGIDAVREYNVVSGPYSAEYGKVAGAQISVVTQSGTNQLHGSVFEFLRNSALDARNFFDKGAIPAFKRNQLGGSLGGPIRKDRTFMFGNYEGFRQRLGLSSVAFVPDLNARQGLLPNAQGVPTPVAGLDPGMVPFMAFWPVPNGPVLGNGIALAYSNPNQSIREDYGTTRFDQTFSEKDSLSVVYTIDDGDNLTPGQNPLFGTTGAIRNQITSLQETHIFSPQVINSFTAGFSRSAFLNVSTPLTSFPPSLSFVTGKPPGGVGISGGESGTQASAITPAGGGSGPSVDVRRSLFTFADGLQVINGKHQISAGVWFQRLRSNNSNVSRAWGLASFATLQSFLQGTVATFSVAPNSVPMGWRSWEGAWYLQDSVQLLPNLNLRFGLRHEFSNGWSEVFGRGANFLFDSNGVVQTNPMVGRSLLTENNAKWLFGPRISLAWDPFGNGKTSIRAGIGTYYNQVDAVSYLFDSNPPFNGSGSFSNVPLHSLIPVNPSLSMPPACGPDVPRPCTTYSPKGYQNSYRIPTVESWNFTVEQQITPSTALRVAYVGSQAYHLFVNEDPNSIQPQICSSPAGCTSGGILAASSRGTVPQGAEYIPVGTRPNPYMTYGTMLFSRGNANYNAFQVELIRRFTHGLQFRANYTWSKNLDILSGVASSQSINEAQQVMNRFDQHRDWGPAALNVTHQASGNFSYELPVGQGKPWLNGVSGVAGKLLSGWQVNGIVTLLGGFPFTPQAGSNRSGDGNSNAPDRPSVNPAFTGPVILGSPNRWFNPNAFVLPTPGTYGNLGRGVLTGPGLAEVDFSLFKNTKISERIELQFRGEFFNIINRANFGTSNPLAFSGNTINSSAGVVTDTTTTSRQIQFGLKLVF